jgi:hypothetical protein
VGTPEGAEALATNLEAGRPQTEVAVSLGAGEDVDAVDAEGVS